MKISDHYKHRCASRAFSESFAEIALEFGDYIEQKGGSCVLALRDPQTVRNLRLSFANEEQELVYKRKLLRQRKKILGMALVMSDEQLAEINNSENEIIQALRSTKRKKKAIKCGYVVFGRKSPDSDLTAITVAHPLRSIKGTRIINE